MPGSAKSRVAGKSGAPPRKTQSRSAATVRAPQPTPHPAEVQKRFGNRGAMAFAEYAVEPQNVLERPAPPSLIEQGSDTAVGPAARSEHDAFGIQAPLPASEPVTETSAPDGTKEAIPATQETTAAAEDGAEPVATPGSEVAPGEAGAAGRPEQMPEQQASEDAAMGGEAGAETAAPAETVSIEANSPGGVLRQLVAAPPTQSMQAFGQANAASAEVLKKQTDEAQGQLPEMPAPTGLEQTSLTDVVKAELAKGERAPRKLDGEQSGRETAMYPTAVDAGPPAPSPTPTVLQGKEESDTERGDRELALSAQNALNNIRIVTGEIPSSAGSRPGVDMSGDADPSQMEAFQQSSDSKVTDAAAVARQDTVKDFGENDIFPPETTEILRSERQLGTKVPGAGGVDGLQIPADVAAALDQSTGPIYREKMGAQYDEYRAGEEDYHRDSTSAHSDAQRDIGNLEESARKEQLQQREGAQNLVAGYRQEWQSELDSIDEEYRGKAEKARKKHRGEIDKKRREGESKAAGHLEHAEKEAARKKRKAEEDVRREKARKRKKSGGFWGWAKRAASALVNALKKAVNFIYDNLRKAVKGLFELVKKLVLAAIELARKAIVGLIKAYGAILKGFVSIALAAFPETAERIKAKIDGAVDSAVTAVNTAADMLKKGVAAIIDFLAETIDSLLGLIQDIYNGILTVVGMIISGEFKELLEKLGHLVTAARMAPSRFETAAYEELLGGNLDEPLSPMELAQAGITPKVPGSEDAKAGPMPSSPWTQQNVGVDAVGHNMQLSPELATELLARLGGDGTLEFGESSDPDRSMAAIMGEVKGQEPDSGSKEQKNPPDGLTPRQRAEVKWKIMKSGLAKWWQENKGLVIAGAVAAIVGGIAALILSGGAILGAIPPIMAVLGPIFVGASIAMIATRVRDYVKQSWAGDVQEGSKSLAKGLAAGAVELISLITFKAGAAVLKGGKLAARAGMKAIKGTTRAVSRAVVSSTKYAVSKGKVLFKGIANSGIGRRVKSVREMGERLLARTRFRKFRIVLKGRRFRLEGFINPWVLLHDGTLEEVSFKGKGRSELGQKRTVNVRGVDEEAFVVGVRNKPSGFVDDLLAKSKTDAGKLDNAELFKRLKEADPEDAKALLGHLDRLGFSSTTDAMRKSVQGKDYTDPFDNITRKANDTPKVGEAMEPDHVFPVSKMLDLPGFQELTKAQKKMIVHDTIGLGNIEALPKSLNRSKGNLPGNKWKTALGKDIDEAYQAALQNKQDLIQRKIEAKIREFLAENAAGT